MPHEKRWGAQFMRRGAQDWLKTTEIDMAAFFDLKVDIHHIFPRAWCRDHNVDSGRCDSIINKTPLSWDTNRSIGGRPPSSYLKTIQERNNHSDQQIAELLKQHLIAADELWADSFDAFYESRKSMLIELISTALGKDVVQDDLLSEAVPEYEEEFAAPEPDEELAVTLDASLGKPASA